MKRTLMLLVAVGMTAFTATTPSHATPKKPTPKPPPRYYLHTAAGSYVADWQADTAALQEVRAPHGSTMSVIPPTRAADANVMSSYPRQPGGPRYASFAFPYSGALSSLCVDIWAQAHYGPPTAKVLYVHLQIVPPGAAPQDGVQGTTFITPTGNIGVLDYDESLIRVTRTVTFPKGTTVPAGSTLIMGGMSVANNPDWTMYYDSIGRYSSITVNPRTCTPQPRKRG